MRLKRFLPSGDVASTLPTIFLHAFTTTLRSGFSSPLTQIAVTRQPVSPYSLCADDITPRYADADNSVAVRADRLRTRRTYCPNTATLCLAIPVDAYLPPFYDSTLGMPRLSYRLPRHRTPSHGFTLADSAPSPRPLPPPFAVGTAGTRNLPVSRYPTTGLGGHDGAAGSARHGTTVPLRVDASHSFSDMDLILRCWQCALLHALLTPPPPPQPL